MDNTINLVLTVKVSDLGELLKHINPKVTVAKEFAAAIADVNPTPKKKRRKNSRKKGFTALDHIQLWFVRNKTGHRRDVATYLINEIGYSYNTAYNEVDRFCRIGEKNGTVVRANGFITLK